MSSAIMLEIIFWKDIFVISSDLSEIFAKLFSRVNKLA